ncbi:MAG: DNA mismatch endonuclease Vsr [Acidobacteriota bacterium]
MADTLSRQRRSENMARIRSQDTQPELIVRSLLHQAGFRFRLHSKRLPGKPDIVLPRFKTVVLVHGCLWHGHANCRRGRRPKSNADYWNRKIDRNLARDAANALLLKKAGWKRIVVWECQLKHPESTLRKTILKLNEESSKTAAAA